MSTYLSKNALGKAGDQLSGLVFLCQRVHRLKQEL